MGYTIVNPATTATTVNVAFQQDPSYGPIVQLGPRFGGSAGIDTHAATGRIWSANLAVWAPSYTFDDAAVRSNAGARVTVFS